VTEITAK